MRVLVTGGTGFTGSHLVRRLLERGDEVKVLDYQKGLVDDELRAKGATIELGGERDFWQMTWNGLCFETCFVGRRGNSASR